MIDALRLLLTLFALVGMETGQASWYGGEFFSRPMANGDTYTPDVWGVAHQTLPLGQTVLVISHCGTATVEITDRGPYGVEGRILDVSPRVADVLFCGGYGAYKGVAYGMEQVMVIGGNHVNLNTNSRTRLGVASRWEE